MVQPTTQRGGSLGDGEKRVEYTKAETYSISSKVSNWNTGKSPRND